jgi:hypothetical protein
VDAEQWVVVTFGGAEEPMPAGWMDALLPVEMAAVEALEGSGLGTIDGNEIGQYEYELYFVGSDAADMWEVLAPVFEEAPVAWTRVELRDGLEDPAPTVVVPES